MKRIILNILIIICVFILIGNTKDRFEKCKYKHFILDDNDLNNMKELYIHLTHFFKEKNIKYFAIGGTLIGTVRNGGLMPFDDDIDVGVLQEDISKIESYTNGDYYFGKAGFGYKFFKKDREKTTVEIVLSTVKNFFGIIEIPPKQMFIDVMVFELKDDIYTIIGNNWPNEAIKPDELLPLTLKQYSSMETYVPRKYISYLNRAFPQWDTTIKLNCGHFVESDNCVSKKMGTPVEFDVHYDNDKYLCYTKL